MNLGELNKAATTLAPAPASATPISPEFFAVGVCPWKVSDIQARILSKPDRNFFRIKPKSVKRVFDIFG